MSRPEGFAVVPRYLWYDSSIPLYERGLLVSLTSRVGAECTCWPSHAALAKELGVSTDTVKRGLARLRERGLVSWRQRKRPDGGQSSNLYKIEFSPFGEEVEIEGGSAPEG